jgi:hypothetical protein
VGNASDKSPVHQTVAKLLQAQFDGIKKEPLPKRWLELINGLDKNSKRPSPGKIELEGRCSASSAANRDDPAGSGQKAFDSGKAKK